MGDAQFVKYDRSEQNHYQHEQEDPCRIGDWESYVLVNPLRHLSLSLSAYKITKKFRTICSFSL